MLFAFRDIRKTQSNVSINVSVFDELFDSSLDSSGLTCIIDLLTEMTSQGNECFYVITHKKDNIDNYDNYGCNVIKLEKRNGISYMVVDEQVSCV